MWFRYCAYYSFILLILLWTILLIAELAASTSISSNTSLATAHENLDKYRKQGQNIGRSIKPAELSAEDIQKITPKELRGKEFDSTQARQQLGSGRHQDLEQTPTADLDPTVGAILANGENALKTQQIKAEIHETLEKCLLENELVLITLHHTLNVEVIHKPQQTKKIKRCIGHSEEKKSRHPHKYKKKKEQQLAADPIIKWFKVYIDKNGFGHRDEIVSEWIHYDDVPQCHAYREEKKEISAESWEEVDTWHMDKLQGFDGVDCILINTKQGAPETRIINGQEVSRPYWEKKQELQCVRPHTTGCEFLKGKSCRLFSEQCLKKSGSQCLLWEKTFKCRTGTLSASPDLKNMYGIDPNLWEMEDSPNQSFPDVATKLALIDQMKKELQQANTADVRYIRLFRGSDQQCSKSITDKVLYDCCEGMDGLATQVKLSKCTSDEIALAESRAKGLTHYVGETKEKFLGLFVSRKEQVFCVFPTKLARVFQEQAREQLRISWGEADHPDCRGLTQEEIKGLDFSKLNLIEAFEIPKEIDNHEKIQKIEARLKQRIEAL